MLARLTLKFWPFLLLFFLIAGALSVPPTIRLYKNISTDPIDLLPSDHPNVATLREVRKKIEERTRVAIVLESERPEATRATLEDLAGRLRHESFVHKVIDRKVGYRFFDKNKLLFLELEDLKTIRDRIDRRIQHEKLKGLLIDLGEDDEFDFKDLESKYRRQYSDASRSEYLMSEDGKIYALYLESVDTSPGIGPASRFYDRVAEFVRNEKPMEGMKIHLAGPSKVLEYRALLRDLKIAGIVSGIALLLPLLLRFRNPITAILIFIPLFIGIPISFALSTLVIHKLSVITSFLFAILGGLGIETGIHLFSGYHAERSQGRSIADALRAIFGRFLRAMLTSVASVAVTFLLLVVNDFRGFSEFGLIAGIGLWVIFSLYFFFFPPLLILAEKIGLLRFRPDRAPRDLPLSLPRNRIRIGLVLVAFFSLYSLFSPFRIGFEYDSKKIRADIPEVRLAKEKQRKTQSRVNNPAVVIVSSEDEALALKEAVRKRREQGGPESTIDTSRSYYDLVPQDQKDKMVLIKDMERMFSDPTIRLVKGEQKKDLDRFREALKETKPFSESDVPEEVKQIFRGRTEIPGSLFFVNALPDLEMDDGRNAMRFAEEVHEVKTPGRTFYPSSDASIFGLVLKTMFGDIPRVLILSLLSVAAFLYLDFRSWKKTGLALLSIGMGILWLLGILSLFGIRFNFYNMIIIPAVMGMSVDNAIHILHSYDELGRGSIKRVLSSTGLSCLLASLTNAAGFVGLLFSIHRGLYSIGLVAVLGVGTCLLSTLVFLPTLLVILESRDKNKVAL